MPAARTRSIAGLTPSGIRARLRALRARWRRIPDREAEMAINRIAFCIVVFLYLKGASALGFEFGNETLWAIAPGFALYFAAAWVIAVHMLYTVRVSRMRRIAAIVCDMATVSYGLVMGGEPMAIMYSLYLWTIFGNGFRFGVPYLRIATVGAVFGFGSVICLSSYWMGHWGLSAGLMLAIIMLPLYAGSLIRKLSQARIVAEEASRAKTMFLAGVSHELRTPLNAIIGMSSLLQGSKLSANQRDMSQTIHASARTLLRLINSVLDFSRLEAGQMPSKVSSFDLHALLIDIRAMTAAQCIDKPLRISLAVDPLIPAHARADRRAIEEALINLAGNAVKFTAKGHVVIGAELIEHDSAKFRIRFYVDDSGIGISPDAQGRIFDRFTQADDSILNRFGGTGLGLAIAKQLVEGAGGSIGLESEPGTGSTFWFEIEVEQSTTMPEASDCSGIRVVVLANKDEDIDDLARQFAMLKVSWQRAGDVPEFCKCVREIIELGQDRCLGMCPENESGTLLSALDGLIAHKDWSRLFSLVELSKESRPSEPARQRAQVPLAVLHEGFEPVELTNIVRIAASAGNTADAQGSKPLLPARALSILVADDNRTNQKVIRKILEQHGHRVMLAGTGEKALDTLATDPIDLVLMDVNMPDLNGIEATKIYRFSMLGENRRKMARIVGLTADVTPERERLCRLAGMDDVLNKPIEPRALLDYVANIAGSLEGDRESLVQAATTTEKTAEAQSAGESIDLHMIDELERLGGPEFVSDLLAGFLQDAAVSLRQLHAAAMQHDAQAFRDRAHALRSGAANIGAQRIYDLCLSLREVQTRELVEQGQAHLNRLEAEFERLQEALSDRMPTNKDSHLLN